MEEEFLILHNILVQQFAILKGDIMSFLKNNSKLLQDHLDNLPDDETGRCTLKKFRAFMLELFGVMERTTDYVGDMISMSKTMKNLLPSKLFDADECMSVCSDRTITGDLNGFCKLDRLSLLNGKQSKVDDVDDLSDECEIPSLPCGVVNTSNYEVGSIIPKAFVSSIDVNGVNFHICVSNPLEIDLLFKLYSSNNRKTFEYFPPHGVVFGMKIDGGIVRAIRCATSSSKVFLPDFGDFVEYKYDLENFYHLTLKEQNLPAQAIPCKLQIVDGDGKRNKNQLDRLISLLYGSAGFKVIKVINQVLFLEILPNIVEDKQKTEEKKLDVPEDRKECVDQKNNQIISTSKTKGAQTFNQLSPEEIEMLYEEPPCTSNALKAVLGYVPKDDQRICRFYDPKIDSCFKGNNCRQLHVPLLKEHFTKDVVPAKSYGDKTKASTTLYKPFQILKVTITHVKNLEYFYGHIIDPQSPAEELYIWKDANIRASDHLTQLPFVYDIVLALFSDGFWYRGQVLDINEFTNVVKIYYIDYGNTDEVPLKNLAKCDENIAKLPAQAVQFRLANIRALVDKKEAYEYGMILLCDLILNQNISLEVVSDYEDLVVRFLNEPFSEAPHLLAAANCIEIIDMVPV